MRQLTTKYGRPTHGTPSRIPFSQTWDSINGANWDAMHEGLGDKYCADILNMDVHADGMVTRGGSRFLGPATRVTAPQIGVPAASIVVNTSDGEYFIHHCEDSTVWFDAVSESSRTVGKVGVHGWSASNLSIPYADGIACLVPGFDVVYLFHPDGNYVLEYLSSYSSWTSRPMGMPAPVFYSIASGDADSGDLDGVYNYGLELQIIEDGIITRRSGVRTIAGYPVTQSAGLYYRAYSRWRSGSGVEVTVKVSAEASDGSELYTYIENFGITHVVLYRSLDLDGTSGSTTELYQAVKMTAAAFLATYDDTCFTMTADGTSDDDMLDSYSDTLVESEGINLKPLPAASIGTIVSGKIFVGNVSDADIDETGSRMFYGGDASTTYIEQYAPISYRVDVNMSNGQKITGLYEMDGNLIILKSASTYYVSSADTSNGVTEITALVGSLSARNAVEVPGLGLAVLCQDYKFRILSRSLAYVVTLDDESNFSIPVSSLFAAADELDVVWRGGALWVNVHDDDGYLYVMQVERGLGWTRYRYPFVGEVYGLALINQGVDLVAFRNSQNGYAMTVLLDTDADTDCGLYANVSTFAWEHSVTSSHVSQILENVTSSGEQTIDSTSVGYLFPIYQFVILPMANAGDGFLEVWHGDLMAALVEAAKIELYSQGRIWGVDYTAGSSYGSSADVFEEDPETLSWDDGHVHTYQWFSKIYGPVIGRSVYAALRFLGDTYVQSFTLSGTQQSGPVVPGFDPAISAGW